MFDTVEADARLKSARNVQGGKCREKLSHAAKTRLSRNLVMSGRVYARWFLTTSCEKLLYCFPVVYLLYVNLRKIRLAASCGSFRYSRRHRKSAKAEKLQYHAWNMKSQETERIL